MRDCESWLAGLEKERSSNPGGTYQALLDGIQNVPFRFMPLWHGIAASCLRQMLLYEDAEGHILEGLNLARKNEDYYSVGDLHQRYSMIWYNRVRYEEALIENCRAIVCFVELDNKIGIAKCFVDRGAILGQMECLTSSSRAFKWALANLPPSEGMNLGAAHQGLAVNLLKVGDLRKASEHLKKSIDFPFGPMNKGMLCWTAGKILAEQEQFEQAESMLFSAIQRLKVLAPIECAIASIDYCDVLKANGKEQGCHLVASELRHFLQAFEHNRAAQLTLMELSNRGLAGEGVTRALLQTARARVIKAQATRASPPLGTMYGP